MKVEIINGTQVITADEGKVLQRKTDFAVFGSILFLGITHYEYKQKLDTPFLELPEHYREIEDPNYVAE